VAGFIWFDDSAADHSGDCSDSLILCKTVELARYTTTARSGLQERGYLSLTESGFFGLAADNPI
jgi:hypothetical protein